MPLTSQEVERWLGNIAAGNADFRRRAGRGRLALLTLAARLLAAPRLVAAALGGVLGGGHGGRRSDDGPAVSQLPWLPPWPGLAARPVHDPADHPWTRRVAAAHAEILAEMWAVREGFDRARYDSDANPKPWRTYYFFLEGRPVAEHLAACPRTAALLRTLPHNALHVCFSAIPPGGTLHPHTGPTNASLTAHLGLENCAGAKLWVGEAGVDYRDGEVVTFDDSFVHWVENGGSGVRCTLMITFWHPSLSWPERWFLGRILRMRLE